MKSIDWSVERLLPREVAPRFEMYRNKADQGFQVAAFGRRLIVSLGRHRRTA